LFEIQEGDKSNADTSSTVGASVPLISYTPGARLKPGGHLPYRCGSFHLSSGKNNQKKKTMQLCCFVVVLFGVWIPTVKSVNFLKTVESNRYARNYRAYMYIL